MHPASTPPASRIARDHSDTSRRRSLAAAATRALGSPAASVGQGTTEDATGCLLSAQLRFCVASPHHVRHNPLNEVLVSIFYQDFLNRSGRRFAGPWGLPGGAIAFKTSPRRRYPVPEALASVGEIAVPAEGC